MKKALLITLFPIVIGLLVAACPLCAQDTAAWVDFQQKAAAWRALPVKPPIAEEVRLERVQAENAISEKRLADSVDHYESGLKIDPVWPEGHFNAALIYAELENYDKAIWHMRAYVELVPDAPDARAGRDQIAIWQDKVKLQETVVFRDPETNLMWQKQDSLMNYAEQYPSPDDLVRADNYCHDLRLGGYSGWRLPSYDEVATIHNTNQKVNGFNIKGGIKLSTGWVATSPSQGKGVFIFKGFIRHIAVLCVRSSGE